LTKLVEKWTTVPVAWGRQGRVRFWAAPAAPPPTVDRGRRFTAPPYTLPRSAADRKFGFKAKGLVRILLGVDVAELKKALDELGLEVADQPVGLLDLLGDLFDNIFGPILLARDITAAFLDEFFPIDAPPPEAGPTFDDILGLLARAARDLERAKTTIADLAREHVAHQFQLPHDRRMIALIGEAARLVDNIEEDTLEATATLSDLSTLTQESANAATTLREALAKLKAEEDEKRLAFRDKLEEDVPEVPATATI